MANTKYVTAEVFETFAGHIDEQVGRLADMMARLSAPATPPPTVVPASKEEPNLPDLSGLPQKAQRALADQHEVTVNRRGTIGADKLAEIARAIVRDSKSATESTKRSTRSVKAQPSSGTSTRTELVTEYGTFRVAPDLGERISNHDAAEMLVNHPNRKAMEAMSKDAWRLLRSMGATDKRSGIVNPNPFSLTGRDRQAAHRLYFFYGKPSANGDPYAGMANKLAGCDIVTKMLATGVSVAKVNADAAKLS